VDASAPAAGAGLAASCAHAPDADASVATAIATVEAVPQVNARLRIAIPPALSAGRLESVVAGLLSPS
jgi:hypothetical protein